MGKQSNLYNQNRHQYDFLNPDGKKNLHLDHEKKQWVEAVPVYYPIDNKEQVKIIEQDIKSIKSEIQNQFENQRQQQPFKMEKFKNVEPCIKAVQLENRVADQHQRDERIKIQKKLEEDPKYFIKRNMKTVYKINEEVQKSFVLEEQQKQIKKAQIDSRYGVLPTYLVNRKKQAEIEKQQTLKQIQLNMRPQGTIRLRDEEILQMRENLEKDKKGLSTQIQRVSISQYTKRAKDQTKGITKKLDEVDKALTVFERDSVFIKC